MGRPFDGGLKGGIKGADLVGFFQRNENVDGTVAATRGVAATSVPSASSGSSMHGAQRLYAEQMRALAARAAVGPDDPRLEPIAGVPLDQYAAISKAAATRGVDTAGLVRLALGRGVASEAAWREAQQGWNARMRGDFQLATHFGHLYQAAAGLQVVSG
jgi:hypothetical protein